MTAVLASAITSRITPRVWKLRSATGAAAASDSGPPFEQPAPAAKRTNNEPSIIHRIQTFIALVSPHLELPDRIAFTAAIT
jgi:hypothetical protein